MRQWLIDAYMKAVRLYIYGDLHGPRAIEAWNVSVILLEQMTHEEAKETNNRFLAYNPFDNKNN